MDEVGVTDQVTEADVIDQVTEALRDVIEPEIGINIVDLGLVYGVRVVGPGAVAVDMTMTSPGCPDGDLLRYRVCQSLGEIELDIAIEVNWVWKPAWGPERVSPEGREQLRALGISA
jgi:metal-sulfur cluster biosynthetic enzyme